MCKNLISYGNLAEQLKPEIERELQKKVKESAIIMALRRYEEELQDFDKKIKKFKFQGEIIVRTNIIDFNIVKSSNLLNKIKNLYSLVNFGKGDTLNIILGSNEVSIVTNEKYKNKLPNFLKGEKILNKEFDLVALTIVFEGKNFLTTPGVIFTAIRKLAWEQINIYEIVSTMTELTFILGKKDSMKAYNALQEFVSK
jgi:aspartokinase